MPKSKRTFMISVTEREYEAIKTAQQIVSETDAREQVKERLWGRDVDALERLLQRWEQAARGEKEG